ncbi:MAG: mechanosensitive ion channel family protein [Flexistipes sinusarabici]|uniref:Mechanosensitive ion channel family protein n=1 Tax=Flexistipes sinusarabici TaxID=2352 RepID=A0A5D0ML72_FLESI|nr:mechanosensitive ion channel family protein [Flexistipes sinusarabici]TYB33756.1 MAG: mechanosensitive ion channel family protein [Flexistipes sinusarabici]
MINLNNFFEQLPPILSYEIFNVNVGEMLAAFGILLLFFVLKHVLLNIVFYFLKKTTKKTLSSFDDDLVEIVKPPLNLSITATGFFLAINVFTFTEDIDLLLLNIYKSFLIGSFFWVLYRAENLLKIFMEKYAYKKQIEIAVEFLPLFRKLIRAALIVFAVTIIIQEWGYNIGAIITGLGIGGLAVALAAKDTLANFFGSLMIIMDRPFAIGDWIVVADTEGVVEEIGFRTTKIRTFEKALVSVPNSKIATDNVTNWSRRSSRRILCRVGATYSTPPASLKKAVNDINDMLINHKSINNDMIMVYFDEFAASSLNIFVYCFAATSSWAEYLEIKQDVYFNIMDIFQKHGISFAFPSMSLYHETDDESPLVVKQKD